MSMAFWRPNRYLGPLIALATVAAIALFERYVYPVANPGAIFFLAIVFAAYAGGIGSGLVAAAITLAFSILHFVGRGNLFEPGHHDLERIVILCATAPAIAVLVGMLRSRTIVAIQRERHARLAVETANRRLTALEAACNEVTNGVVLLDHELRAQFINKAFRALWKLPDEVADRQPPFVALMYHGRDTRAYAVPDERLDAYVAERVRRIQAGDLDPLDIKLRSGEVFRLECTVLPAGGRMLTYTAVTDLVERASVDGMTGLFNRRHFLELAEGEWTRLDRYERPLSLMMLDIDYFKSINDRFGHDVGDHAIVHVAKICHDAKRVPDIVARIGGEEFALLLPETPLESARVFAERLRQRIADTPVMIAGAPFRITVSIGIAEVRPAMVGIAALMKDADAALYRAKNSGRNRVAAGPDEAVQPRVALAS